MSMQPIRLTLVQADTRWHDAAVNRDYYRELLHRHGDIGDLVVLPEMFLTGFTNATDSQAQDMDGEGVAWMRERAAELEALRSIAAAGLRRRPRVRSRVKEPAASTRVPSGRNSSTKCASSSSKCRSTRSGSKK